MPSPEDRTKRAKVTRPRERQRILTPVELLSEVIFGLIMALSITGSLSIAENGKSNVRTMLIGALGCNTAWGIVDALMYLVATLTERYRARTLLLALQKETDPEAAHRMIAERLPPLIAASIQPAALAHLRQQFITRTVAPKAGLTGRDLLGALGVFLLVFLATFPVILPFLFPIEPLYALRLSNAVAVMMLFALGCWLGRYTGQWPIVTGAAAVALGSALVGLTILLGG